MSADAGPGGAERREPSEAAGGFSVGPSGGEAGGQGAPRPREGGAEPRRPGGGVGERRTLLVVDDDFGVRESLRLLFEKQCRVLLADSGEQALRMLARETVDAAIVDLRMAGMSGIELLRQFKEADPVLEVTILTGFAQLETAREALQYGACDYLAKPFDAAQMRAVVARMLMRREESLEMQRGLERLQGLELELREVRNREERLETRAEIYGSVLHDISKPLTVIVGILALVTRRLRNLQRLEGGDVEHLRSRLEAANRQARNIIEVAQRYLGILRGDHPEQACASVNQVFADLRELLSFYPAAEHREVTFMGLPVDAYVAANGTDLLQILLNLTINALQAIPACRLVEVVACACQEPLNLQLWEDSESRRFVRSEFFTGAGPLVAIAVRDDGQGIEPEVVRRLFDPGATTKPAGRGTGLGLTIVKRLVLLSRGALALQTKPGGGTTVTVFLPLARQVGGLLVGDPEEPGGGSARE